MDCSGEVPKEEVQRKKRRLKYDIEILHDAVYACPLELRGNFEELSPNASIPVGILDGALERGDLDSQSRRILPKLYK